MAPDVFWSMSFPEWRAALAGFAERRGARGVTGMGRDEMNALLQRFPDARM